MVCTYLFFSNVILYGGITSNSMSPTLKKGDLVIINGLAYSKEEPERGDIVIFQGHEDGIEGERIIKRIIGLPGDTLYFIDGQLYINGEMFYEDYIDVGVVTDSFRDFEDIPENCYFVMGDNREASWDSRSWENPYVERDEIIGRMIIRLPLSDLLFR